MATWRSASTGRYLSWTRGWRSLPSRENKLTLPSWASQRQSQRSWRTFGLPEPAIQVACPPRVAARRASGMAGIGRARSLLCRAANIDPHPVITGRRAEQGEAAERVNGTRPLLGLGISTPNSARKVATRGRRPTPSVVWRPWRAPSAHANPLGDAFGDPCILHGHCAPVARGRRPAPSVIRCSEAPPWRPPWRAPSAAGRR